MNKKFNDLLKKAEQSDINNYPIVKEWLTQAYTIGVTEGTRKTWAAVRDREEVLP